jgi:nucleoside-diphosphate-sugar epimerase
MCEKDKILVTGAGGNVGQYISIKLSEAGYEVIGLYRHTVPKNVKYKLHRAELSEKMLELEGIHTVIHTAAALEGTAERLVRDNIQATQNLICFAEHSRVERIIYMSTVSVYGDVDGMLCEGGSRVNVELYGEAKHICECLVNESMIPEKLILQLPRVVGPYTELGDVRRSGFLSMAKKILWDEDVTCYIPKVKYNNYLHVADLEGFLEIILKSRGWGEEKLLLGAKEQLEMMDILQIMKQEIGSRSKIWAEDKGVLPKCALVKIDQAEKMGFSPSHAECMLKRFIREAYRNYRA